jgi:hypothetical protein
VLINYLNSKLLKETFNNTYANIFKNEREQLKMTLLKKQITATSWHKRAGATHTAEQPGTRARLHNPGA